MSRGTNRKGIQCVGRLCVQGMSYKNMPTLIYNCVSSAIEFVGSTMTCYGNFPTFVLSVDAVMKTKKKPSPIEAN